MTNTNTDHQVWRRMKTSFLRKRLICFLSVALHIVLMQLCCRMKISFCWRTNTDSMWSAITWSTEVLELPQNAIRSNLFLPQYYLLEHWSCTSRTRKLPWRRYTILGGTFCWWGTPRHLLGGVSHCRWRPGRSVNTLPWGCAGATPCGLPWHARCTMSYS